MSKVALITDTHIGVRNEAEVFTKLHEEMFESFFQFLKENDIKEVWHLGDFYDNRKYISSKLQNFVRNVWVNKIQEQGIKVKMIVGNHDTFFKSSNTPNSVTENLSHDSNHHIIDEEIFEHKIGNKTIAFVPWVSPERHESFVKQLTENFYDLVLGHFDIKGMLMQGSTVSEHGFNPKLFAHHGKVLSGHYHKKSSSDNIHYLGNPIPTTWGEAFDTHGWHTIDENLNIEYIPYVKNIYQRIEINTDGKIEEEWNGSKFVRLVITKKNEFHYQNFLEKLRGFDIVQLSIIDNMTSTTADEIEFDEEELRDDFLTLISKQIDSSGIERKDDLKELMSDLYNKTKTKGIK